MFIGKSIFTLLLNLSIITLVHANCDLTRFRWGCDMMIHPYPTPWAKSLVYCGDAYGYVTEPQFNRLVHYQRANVHFSLKVNGEFIEGPCIPASRR